MLHKLQTLLITPIIQCQTMSTIQDMEEAIIELHHIHTLIIALIILCQTTSTNQDLDDFIDDNVVVVKFSFCGHCRFVCWQSLSLLLMLIIIFFQ